MNSGNELFFLPLGGVEEIGMNLNLYAIGDDWLMVDLGVSFGEDRLPGIDVVMPDPSFIESRRGSLLGLVLTHGHEDHLGAVQYLWPRLRCPIFATPFTAGLLRAKLSDTDFRDQITLHELPLGGRFTLGPFDLEFVTVTHSIPESNALSIRTKFGTVLHTGDFKIDDTPVVGDKINADKLSSLGDEGVLAMVCDSTNVFEFGQTQSEGILRESLDTIVSSKKGRVALTTFASNWARIETAAWVAKNNNRHPVLVGRSLFRILDVARDSGYYQGVPKFLDEREASMLPPGKALFICTGSQGEPRGAMSRIADNSHPNVHLESGDTVIFSSKIIPGNERSISRLHNRLVSQGIEIITEKEQLVHVSGHPSRDDLTRMYSWIRPKIAIPVHGETRHIAEHVALARSLQIPEALGPTNGALIRLHPGPVEIVDHVTAGRLALDGNRVIDVDSQILRERRRLMFNGMVTAMLVLDSEGQLASSPAVNSRGVFDDDDGLSEEKSLQQEITTAFYALPASKRENKEELREAIRLVIRREIRTKYETRPDIHIDLVQLGAN